MLHHAYFNKTVGNFYEKLRQNFDLNAPEDQSCTIIKKTWWKLKQYNNRKQ